MSSTRLPGKVLADLDGEPVLDLLIRRLQRAESVSEVIVATSGDPSDDPIAELYDAVRGPLDDVLSRFLIAIGDHDGPVFRITGDCPLIDPRIVDMFAEIYVSGNYTYGHPAMAPRTLPDGLDVEIVSAKALRQIAAEHPTRWQREHVTPAIRARPDRFPAFTVDHDPNLGWLRWTLDTPEDLLFMQALVRTLGSRRYEANCQEILRAAESVPPREGIAS